MSTALLEAPLEMAESAEVVERNPEALYEIIDGIEVELPPMSMEAVELASDLGFEVALFARQQNLGKVYHEMLIKLNLSNGRSRSRRPDFIYVSHRKWPQDRTPLKDASWDIVPDVCVEVMSPSDDWIDIEEKIVEYFEAGVPQVWVVLPEVQTVKIYESRFRNKLLGPDDTLTGGDILPGFELALGKLFRVVSDQQ